MSTEKSARRPRGEDRRRQLTAAAAALFFERGYPHVSVADIARRAGVSTPTVYRYFDDKQALLFAATQDCVAAFERGTDEALDGADDQSAALIDAAAALSGAQPQVTSLWRWSGQHLTTEQNREVVARTREVLRRWAGAIAQQRPDLTQRESTYLAGAILSVTGSISGRSLRVDQDIAESTLRQLIRRLISLTPSAAPPIPELPADLFATPGRRDEILDAAARLFADQGFAGTGMDEIGAAVGITGPSVYKHCPSKESILIAIGQRSALRLEAGALAAAATSPEPRGQLELQDQPLEARPQPGEALRLPRGVRVPVE
ncbi:TetR/AcrR family transcriptional regulator [Gordonia sp. VNK21]|uniref:TetR/AcrR family transcriptional regulator n=1 Tax=Gordonia sp. VNK21 TaxID=3382483 RepID=UPI0038D38E05